MHLFSTLLLLMSLLTVGINATSRNSTVSEAKTKTISNSSERLPFIVGGVEATKHEFPWMVHLKTGENVMCGGALIKLDIVLTAAHCVKDWQPNRITITAGDHDIQKNETTEQTRPAQVLKWHEDYQTDESGQWHLHDIALIKLGNPFNQTDAVRTINAATTDSSSTGCGTVTGWGRLANGSYPDVLMKITVPIVENSNANCSRLLRDVGKTQFCAGGEHLKGSCTVEDATVTDDSGGPFICNDQPTQICGLVSYGPGACGTASQPGIYQKVAPYTGWIQTMFTEWGERDNGTNGNNGTGRLFSLAGYILLIICVCTKFA